MADLITVHVLGRLEELAHDAADKILAQDGQFDPSSYRV